MARGDRQSAADSQGRTGEAVMSGGEAARELMGPTGGAALGRQGGEVVDWIGGQGVKGSDSGTRSVRGARWP